jgi:hypothetical protein
MGKLAEIASDIARLGCVGGPTPDDPDVNPRAVIGGNMPPPTPYEIAANAINELWEEATLWLDGAKVDSQELADGIANLLNMIRAAEKKADEARKVEKQPHLDASREVDARYKEILDRAKLASDGCKKALAPWLQKLDDEKRAEAERKRREAEEAARIAQEALRTVQGDNLAARAEAEALVNGAKKAERIASKAEKSTATAGNGIGRAVGLKSVWTATLTNDVEALRHYWRTRPDDMRSHVQAMADADIRAGKREIPGFEITEQKVAV